MATAVSAPGLETGVIHVGGLHYAREKSVVERVLSNRPGDVGVEANPVAQTATVTFDPSETGVSALRKWVEDCGYHCAVNRCRASLRPLGRAPAL
jgi:P-type Cu2+ transporter